MPFRDDVWPQGTPCWVDCQVDDPAAAGEFYGRLFGWQVMDSPPEAGGYLMGLRNGHRAAGIGPKPSGTAMPSAWTTYFAVDSADNVAARITAAGGQTLMPPFDVLDVGRMCMAVDPTGAAFGIWEAREHKGAGVFNEHGAYCWNELHTRGYADAQSFYAAVFGWTFTEIGDGTTFIYSTFTPPAVEDSVGGMNDDTVMPGEMPAYWLTWFQVDDSDAAVATASSLGAAIMMGPDDTPFGRMSIVRAPQGEVFGLLDPTRRVGQPPMPGQG